jgi:hypothetical protein
VPFTVTHSPTWVPRVGGTIRGILLQSCLVGSNLSSGDVYTGLPLSRGNVYGLESLGSGKGAWGVGEPHNALTKTAAGARACVFVFWGWGAGGCMEGFARCMTLVSGYVHL